MPTYTINYGQPATNAWMQGASALADALSPDYAGMADAKVKKAQAENYYAGAYADEQLARDRAADAAYQERQNRILTEMDARLEQAGVTDPLEKSAIVAGFGMQVDPVEWTKNMGKGSLALGGLAGVDDARMNQLQLGSGMAAGDTLRGFDQDQRRKSTEFLMGEAGDNARKRMELDAEAEQSMFETFNGTVTVPENSTVYLPPGHALYGQSSGGMLGGQTSIGKDETVIPPGGGKPMTGVVTPNEPDLQKYNRGTEEETVYYAPNDPRADDHGFVHFSTAPRSGTTGQIVQTPFQEGMNAALIEEAVSVVARRSQAQDLIATANLAEQLLDGTPTGWWTDMSLPLRQMAAQMGLADRVKTGDIEALNAVLGNFAMSRIQDTKGAVSEKEMAYFIAISPALSKTPEGNRLLMEIQRNIGARQLRAANKLLAAFEQNPNITPVEAANVLTQFYASPEGQIFPPDLLANTGLPPLDAEVSPLYMGGPVQGGGAVTGDAELDALINEFGTPR